MTHMPSIINQGLGSSLTKDWLNASRNIRLTAFDPCSRDLLAAIMVMPTDAESASETPATREHSGSAPSNVKSSDIKNTAYTLGKVTTQQPLADVVSEPVNHPSAIAVGRLGVKAVRVRTKGSVAVAKGKVIAKRASRSDWKAKKSR
jgi:hypothetical protein